MDVLSLEPEELQIEFEIRQIQSGPSNVRLLQTRILAEAQFPLLVPSSPHASGLRSPSTELRLCSLKLDRVSACLENEPSLSMDMVHQLRSRLTHILGRLARLQTHRLETDHVPPLRQKCEILLTRVQNLQISGTCESDNPVVTPIATDRTPGVPSEIPSRAARFEPSHTIDAPVPNCFSTPILRPSVNQDNEQTQDNLVDFFSNSDHKTAPLPHSSPTSMGPSIGRANLPTPPAASVGINRPSETPGISTYEPPNVVGTAPAGKSDLHAVVGAFGSMLHDFRRSLMTQPNWNHNQAQPSGIATSDAPRHQPMSNTSRTILGWNLKFRGAMDDLPIERFLTRVNQMALSAGINLNACIPHLTCLLSGVALEFCWSVLERDPTHNWDSLQRELLQRFGQGLSTRELRRKLDSRKQRYPHERYGEFYDAIMQIALQATTTIPDRELLDILLNNIRPGLQLALAGKNISSIGQLAQEARYLENLWKQLGHNPESGLIPPRARVVAETSVLPVQPDNYDEVCALDRAAWKGNHNRLPNATEKSENRCWNCRSIGHTFKLCRQQRTVFCFGCGLANTYLPDCLNCQRSKSGNYRAKDIPTRGPFLRPSSAPKTPTLTDSASNTDPEFYRLFQRPSAPS